MTDQTADRALPDPETPSLSRLLKTLAITLAVAALILVVVVLPAEYQIDPTGLGRTMGLDRLGGGPSAEVLEMAPLGASVSRDEAFRTEEKKVALAAGEEMELKIAMAEGDTVVFSWQTDRGEIYSDFHAEPYGEPPGGAIRYEESEGASAGHGAVNAPFAGHHGWYWVNPNDFPVQVTLEISGFFAVIKERRR